MIVVKGSQTTKSENLCLRCSYYSYAKFNNGKQITECSSFGVQLREFANECSDFSDKHPINRTLDKYSLEAALMKMKIHIFGESKNKAGFVLGGDDD